MKFTAMTTMMLMASVMGHSQSKTTDREVSVCTEGDAAALGAVLRAQTLVSKMFAEIGVAIDWQYGLRNCSVDSIRVSVGRSTAKTLKPGALAYALPYEGTHIEVFYDRISNNWEPAMVPAVLAHVLVHEITHILEGFSRHSAYGVMKAHWDERDYFLMKRRPLGFAAEDVDLIYRGLTARARGAMVARNLPNATVPNSLLAGQ
jgi:hypothetical protein